MKYKLIGLSILIIVCITGLLYWETLQEQTHPPSEQWSRSFQLETIEGNFAKLQSVQEENGYTISMLDFKKLEVLSCDKELECKRNRTIDSLNTYKNSWSDGTDSYYIKENSLIHTNTTSGEKVIASDVANFTKTVDSLVYWTENKDIVILESPFTKEEQRFRADEPVNFVKILEDQIFVVTENKQDKLYTLYSLSNELSELFTFTISGQENLLSMQIFQLIDKSYAIALDKKVLAGGSSTKNIELAQFDLSNHQSPIFDKLSFVENETNSSLSDIQSPMIYQGEQAPIITFSASLYDPSLGKVNKIFVGDLVDTTIQANAVTKVGNRYERSFLLNEETVAYLKMKGASRILEYSSSDETKKLETNNIMEGDYKAAFYTLLSNLFHGFLLAMFSFVWIFLTFIITYGSLFLLGKFKPEQSYKIAFTIHLIALFSMQSISLFKFTTIQSILHNIPFITEGWHFIVLLLLVMILSTIPLFLVRYKVSEETFNLFVLYTTFMNLAILFLLIGPYLF
ncbi:hypothetical protein [Bacillus sp. Cr_A10]|uniref:hypothetical protein n=1 Tax=Bacillus sp. Cr_A10 TaxID=3033993 RepID=UPI0023D9DF0A|nr:hypothetical protein [Bacillus sp. Cr_A10]MDF2065114.1 hypothetical protein [Bacillus sp. Cr_A10]